MKIKSQKKNKKGEFSKEFEMVWESYPRKEGKVIAQKCFNKLREQGHSVAKIEKAIFSYVEHVKDREKKYIKTGGKFFAEGIYDFLNKKDEKNKKETFKIIMKTDHEDFYDKMIEYYNSLSYPQYLTTKHWKHFRKEAITFSNNKCQLCNDRNVELHIHHKTYENRGRETFNDIICLCSKCHKLVHKI